MGFSVTGSQVVLFIAVILAANGLSSILDDSANDTVMSISNKIQRENEKIAIDFEIINDNESIYKANSYYYFYILNTGSQKFIASDFDFSFMLDGELKSSSVVSFSKNSKSSSRYVYPGDVVTFYISESKVSIGEHVLKVVGPNKTYDELEFTIS